MGDICDFSHRKVPKVTRVVTFGISRLWGSLLSGGGGGVVTFRQQKPLNKRAVFPIKKEDKIRKMERNPSVQLHVTATGVGSACLNCVVYK